MCVCVCVCVCVCLCVRVCTHVHLCLYVEAHTQAYISQLIFSLTVNCLSLKCQKKTKKYYIKKVPLAKCKGQPCPSQTLLAVHTEQHDKLNNNSSE